MKRFLFGFLAVLFLILNTIPYLHIMADQSMTNAQIKQVGAFALSSLITSGEATELDFSDYTDSDTDFLLALGELVVTGDPTSLIDCGLDWLGGEIDDAYDSAIQSIREWEYNMSPTLYYWFVDTQPPYELSPTYNNIRDLSQPLRRLLTPPDSDSPTPTPSSDYTTYINLMNSNVGTGLDFFWKNYIYSDYHYYDLTFNFSNSFDKFSYFCANPVYGVGTFLNSPYNASNSNYPVYGTDIITLHIFSDEFNKYNLVTQLNSNNNFLIEYNSNTLWYCLNFRGDPNNNVLTNFEPNTTPYNGTYTLSNVTLEEMFQHISNRFRNVNIYVDDVCWAYVGNSDYPIIIPDQLTIWNDQPLQYEFPSDTYLKLPDLTNIITNAINNSGVVMWSDIADCFVDINGQTAVAVTKIVRNDYDNLYMEQYPYPAMLVGMTDQTKFNEHLLDNSHAYLSPMGDVVQETVNVLPGELVGVLAIGAILTIFAVIINRLLE